MGSKEEIYLYSLEISIPLRGEEETWALWGEEGPLGQEAPGGTTGSPLQHSLLENPWTEGTGGLQPMESQESDMT